MLDPSARYPPIGAYALLSDCHSAALVSDRGSIDWCCMPRIDSASVFGRLLDWTGGGYCAIELDGVTERHRRYLDRTMVLETTLRSTEGTLQIIDCLATTAGGAHQPRQQVLRVVRCVQGRATASVRVAPRFDYGGVPPMIRDHGQGTFTAIGGRDGLVVWSDATLSLDGRHDLVASVALVEGECFRLSICYRDPASIDPQPPGAPLDAEAVDDRLEETLAWWRRWCEQREGTSALDPAVLRSALVLKSLVTAQTGAIVAAPTTSLPEQIGGVRNWDYRYSWIRDSWLTVRSLADVGFWAEADGFRRFVERSAAGSVDELHLLYGVDGAHRLPELMLHELDGYQGSRPVRVGNAASEQLQLDMYGYLVELAWQWSTRGRVPDPAYAAFIVEVVDRVCGIWQEPDHGIWEVRSAPQHFVHSKALCWTAVDRGLRMADAGIIGEGVDRARWSAVRHQLRRSIMERGVSARRGCFVQRLDGDDELDAALLLLPAAGFVAVDDPLMAATVDAIIEDLDEGGLIRRYRTVDGLAGDEGVFVACTFWLVECLAGLGRIEEATAYFVRASAAGNDVGLLSEEVDVRTGELLGNFPQALSHLAHIGAAQALGAARVAAR